VVPAQNGKHQCVTKGVNTEHGGVAIVTPTSEPMVPTDCQHPVQERLLVTKRWKEVFVPIPNQKGKQATGFYLATVYGVATESNEDLFADVWQAAALRGAAAPTSLPWMLSATSPSLRFPAEYYRKVAGTTFRTDIPTRAP
jgi:hypothetical protein